MIFYIVHYKKKKILLIWRFPLTSFSSTQWKKKCKKKWWNRGKTPVNKINGYKIMNQIHTVHCVVSLQVYVNTQIFNISKTSRQTHVSRTHFTREIKSDIIVIINCFLTLSNNDKNCIFLVGFQFLVCLIYIFSLC